VGVALEQLAQGLPAYVEKRLEATFRENWALTAQGSFRDGKRRVKTEDGRIDWDAHSLLTVMWDQWNAAFRYDLGHQERSLVSELREYRNRWAHQHPFDFDDAYRVLDSVRRLLTAVNAPNVEEIHRLKQELIESYVGEQVNTQIQRAAFNRARWWVIAIYVLCAGAITYHMATSGHSGSSALVSFVILVFVYLIYQQFRLEPPLLYGPRECSRCKKIIYRRPCPYCESVQRTPSSLAAL
jgi:hypothetical protein